MDGAVGALVDEVRRTSDAGELDIDDSGAEATRAVEERVAPVPRGARSPIYR